MKTSFEIHERGILRVKVSDRNSERTWTIRSTHKPEQQARAFLEISEVLYPAGIGAADEAPRPGAPRETLRDVVAHQKEIRGDAFESPERRALRLQAESAAANADWAHSDNDEDALYAIGSKLPEFKAKGDTAGFNVLPAAAAAIDGTVYDSKSYRADKSNYVKE